MWEQNECATFVDNPVSLHKYLYANANPVMYVDPSGNFSLMETSIAQEIKATISDLIAPGLTMKKVMTCANLVVTTYDIYQQMKLIFAGEQNILGLAAAIGKGMVTQALLNCTATALLGKSAATVLKVVGIANDMQSFVEAVKSGDPERILIESLRLAVFVYTLKCQCFTEDTLVSTIDGDRPIGELEAGDKVWAYNTETGENEAKAITAVIVTETDVIVHVKTSDGEDIETTMFHPFYVRHSDKESGGSVYDGEWKAASNLLAGDVLQKIDGSTVYVTEVTVEKLPEIINVYNLEIEDLHTYYVADGVLVHNKCKEIENNKKEDNSHSEPLLLETSQNTSGQTDDHHIIPKFRGKSKKYADFISALGINVDEYTITVSGGKGGMHMNLLHGKGGWNQKWMKFIDENSNATINDIFQFAGKMMDEYGLNGYKIHPYGKK